MANPPMADNDIAAVVSAAVAGERERCAKVVDGYAANCKKLMQWERERDCEDIAAAIRAQNT